MAKNYGNEILQISALLHDTDVAEHDDSCTFLTGSV